LIQPDNGHGDRGLVAGKKDFLMIWRGISGSRRGFAFCRSPMHLAFRRRLFIPVFLRFSMENWLAFKKLDSLAERQSGEVEPGSNPPEEASGINAIRFSLF
jgi:hypothetical protein